MNPNWSNRTADPSPWSRPDGLRRLFSLAKIVQVVTLVAAAVLARAFMIEANRNPDVILETPDGRAYRGKPQVFAMTAELFKRNASDIMEALFLVTEKGAIPDLEDFVHPYGYQRYRAAYLPIMDKQNSAPAVPYYQEFYITEIRVVEAGPRHSNTNFRGLLTSRNTGNYSRKEIFIGTQFRREASTSKNPLGWVLYAMVPISREQFFSDEIEKISSAALAQDGPPAAPPTGDASPRTAKPAIKPDSP